MEYVFEWDLGKEIINIQKHGVNFKTATKAFEDPKRKVFLDSKHSQIEDRYYCIAKVGLKIINVRFTMRGNKIRIIGAGFWRKGVKHYEEETI